MSDEGQAERAERAEQSLRTVLDRTTDAIAVHRHGRLVYVNPRALTLFGYTSQEQVVGRSLFDFVSQGYMAIVANRVFLTYTKGEFAPEVEERLLHASGEAIPVEVIAIPIFFEGEPSTLVHIRDIRARKDLETRIRTSDRLASVGLVAAGVAHEINNPLTYALVNLELLEPFLAEGTSTAQLSEARAMFEAIKQGVERAAKVARGVRVFGARGYGFMPVDVHRVLDSCASLAQLEMRGRARLVKEYGNVPNVIANEQHLGQIFLNLLVNAAHASSPGHEQENTVTIATSCADDHVLIEIRDTGAGIPDDIQARIFDPLFTTKSEGTGLGLPIARRLVEDAHGTLSFDSKAGAGTTFRVSLPAAPAPEASVPPPPAPRLRTTKKRILVVDDELQLARALCLVFSADETAIAVSGAEALAKVHADAEYDVILCDLSMSEMGGIELYDALRRERPGLERRIVFMSGGTFSERATTFLASIKNRYIEKPFTAEEVLAAVGAVTD